MGIQKHRGFVAVLLVILLAATAAASLIGLIERDYTGNHTATDRNWFYEAGGVYPSVEWIATRGENFPVVYTKSGSATIELTFTNPQFFTINGTLTVNNVRLRMPFPSEGSPTYVTLSASVSGTLSIPGEGGTDTVTVTVSGLPSYVTLGTIEMDAKVTNGAQQYWTTGGYADWEKVYLTYSTPLEPIDQPWTDLLEYACTWAYTADETGEVASAVTEGLFWSGLWEYDPSSVWYMTVSNHEDTTAEYDLSQALDDGGGYMDCRDASGFVALCTLALGVSTQVRVSWNGDDYDDGIKTNEVCDMGDDALVPANYSSYEWFNYHQYVVIGGDVYDSPIAHLVDPDGESYLWVAVGWDPGEYWQKSDGSGGYNGIVFGPGDASSEAAVTEGGIYRTIAEIE